MAGILKLKINLSKVDKAKLFKGKDGAVYLDATVLLKDENDQYGNNGMIVQDVTKEEREAGKQGAILGNSKELAAKAKPAPAAAKSNVTVLPSGSNVDPLDDLPF